MRKLFAVVVSAAVLACGGEAVSNRTTTFQLVVPATSIEIAGGDTKTIQLLVLGEGAEPVAVTGELPAFATLQGDLLTLAPSRADLGQWDVELVATAGTQAASATLIVNVTRTNTAPTWGSSDLMMSDDAGIYGPGACMAPDRSDCCPGTSCLIGTSPAITLRVCDAEGDAVIVDVEVVPLSDPFTNVPTHSVTGRAGTHTFRCGGSSEECGCFDVPLDGVSPDTAYAFSVRTRDEWGATTQSQASDGAPGWIHQPYMQFTTRP